MKIKPATSTGTHRKAKYFNLHESNAAGMDNAWQVYKKGKGFQLWGSEVGEVGPSCKTIGEALYNEGYQYSGGYAEIETNIDLEELFDIMNMHNFEPFLHNLSELELNRIRIDVESFKNFVIWYAECRKASAKKKD